MNESVCRNDRNALISQHIHCVQPPTQTQLTEIMTQQMTQTDDSNLLLLSPELPLPLAKLLPSCGAPPVPIAAYGTYALGRSPKCDIQVTTNAIETNNNNEHERIRREWAFGLISNRHCTIAATDTVVTVTDTSGNGTCINQTKLLRKGQSHVLHSGDEICVLNPELVQRKIRGKELHGILQDHSFVIVLTQQPRQSCVRVRELAPSLGHTTSFRLADHGIAKDYDIGIVLGTGTVGEVRRATHRITGVQVAVKIMARGRLDAEAKILEQLDHPYVIRLVHVYYEEHTVYLVMELMESDLFEQVSEKQKYTEMEARYVMRRLLAALHYLHEHQQIVHRDLKPENILVRGKEIKLTDFGLAKEDSHGRLRTFCGTPQYFAPEVMSRARTIHGLGRYGKPADLYSLGVILHVMLTGFTPHLDHHQIVWDPQDDECLSPASKSLVQDLLHPNPSARLTVLDACEHPWMLVADGDTHVHPLEDPQLPDFQRMKREASNQPNTTDVSSAKLLQTNSSSPRKSRTPATKESPSDLVTLDQLFATKDCATNTPKLLQRRPLSPFNAKSKNGTPHEHINISLDTSLLAHKSITPGSPCKELSDDEVQSTFSQQTESIGTFGTAEDDAERQTESTKPRRVSEMQQGETANPKKKRVALSSKGIKKKKLTAPSGQKSLKSFFSPSKPSTESHK